MFAIVALGCCIDLKLGQARAGWGGGGGCPFSPAPFPLDAQSALLSRHFFLFFFVIKRPFVKACPV